MVSTISPWIARAAAARLGSERSTETDALAHTLDSACRSLHTAMVASRLENGVPRAVLTLGLTLAKSEWPFLRDVDVSTDGSLTGWAESTRGQAQSTVYAAADSILVHSVRLLELLSGGEAARTMVAAAW